MSSGLHSVSSLSSLHLDSDNTSQSTLDTNSSTLPAVSPSQSLCDHTPRQATKTTLLSSLDQTNASRTLSPTVGGYSVRDTGSSVVTDGAGKKETQPRSSNLSSVSEEFGLKSFSPGSLVYEIYFYYNSYLILFY